MGKCCFKLSRWTLHVTEEVKWEVADLIRKYKPSILITHHRKSMHKDHEACHLIVKDAQFYAD